MERCNLLSLENSIQQPYPLWDEAQDEFYLVSTLLRGVKWIVLHETKSSAKDEILFILPLISLGWEELYDIYHPS